jgi:hypothetical protein
LSDYHEQNFLSKRLWNSWANIKKHKTVIVILRQNRWKRVGWFNNLSQMHFAQFNILFKPDYFQTFIFCSFLSSGKLLQFYASLSILYTCTYIWKRNFQPLRLFCNCIWFLAFFFSFLYLKTLPKIPSKALLINTEFVLNFGNTTR